ncbi:MAG: alpha-amylase [Chloroflexi bacterium]|nr:alpha-amylase [Chloroflexota bacterium]
MYRPMLSIVAGLALALILAACAPTAVDPPGPLAIGLDGDGTDQLVDRGEQTGDMPWWNDRVFYEIFVRSFNDSDGDGIGDLQGVIERLDYLNDGDPTTTTDLGITGIWLMPVAQSPSYHGYDVTDYRSIEEDYGTNEDFRQLMEEAHQRGIVVIVDLVLNHTSTEHPWFSDARTGGEFEDWYVWSEEHPGYGGPWGEPAWHSAGGRFYYGVFWSGMPDLNFENDAVTQEMIDVSRFWLEDLGADGFRLDAIKHMIEDGQRQENTDATKAWLASYNAAIDEISADAFTVGEVWTSTDEILEYVGSAVDIAFEFDLAEAMLAAAGNGERGPIAIGHGVVTASYPAGQYATFLTNHDQDRVLSQLGEDVEANKLAATLLLTSPGVPFIYYGEEIGMLGEKPDERIRTPMHWDDTARTAGFTEGNNVWERLAPKHETYNVADQTGDPDSLLSHYRNLIHLRNSHAALRIGDFVKVRSDTSEVYAFMRTYEDSSFLILLNMSDQDVSDFNLTLEAPVFEDTPEATLVYGPISLEGGVTAPAIGNGIFSGYNPIGSLPPQSSWIIEFTD